MAVLPQMEMAINPGLSSWSTREDSGREDPGGGFATMDRAVYLAARLLRLLLFQPSPLSPWQVPGQARARMQHKHKQARHEEAHSVM